MLPLILTTPQGFPMPKRDQQWLDRHVNDPFVRKAQKDGYRSRACYKLIEIDEKDKLLKKGMIVVDLGAAPGGWSQVAAKVVGDKGKVIAIDLLPIDPIEGVDFIQGDFREQEPYEQLLALTNNKPVDLVMSDLAPNLSGNKSIDLPRMIHLLELAFQFAQQTLRPGGALVMKAFHGEGLEAYVKDLKKDFKIVKWRKPNASRPKSSEIYILAQEFIGYTQS
jgi:23S rRNA (uridine2552-2'-O)-methyltransferase